MIKRAFTHEPRTPRGSLQMIDEIIDFLQDGKPHFFNEILCYLRRRCKTPIPLEETVGRCMEFLTQFGFIHGDHNIFVMRKPVRKFLKEIKSFDSLVPLYPEDNLALAP